MKLTDPFPVADLEWRVMRSGLKNGKPWAQIVPYVTARAVAERLDEVYGPESWSVSYTPLGTEGFMCRITVDGVSKEDGASRTDIEPIKGGISDAFKRAGVAWGIGRYLYAMPTAWADFSDRGEHSAKIENQWFKWNPPQNAVRSIGVAPTHQPAPAKPVATPSRPAQEESDLSLEGESDADNEKSFYIAEMRKMVLDLIDPGEEETWNGVIARAAAQPLEAVRKAKATLTRIVMEQETT